MDLHLVYTYLTFHYNANAFVYHALCFMSYELLCMAVVTAVCFQQCFMFLLLKAAYVDFTMLHNTSLADCMKFFYMYF